eukprot:3787096-Amphidinium_carterae.1
MASAGRRRSSAILQRSTPLALPKGQWSITLRRSPVHQEDCEVGRTRLPEFAPSLKLGLRRLIRTERIAFIREYSKIPDRSSPTNPLVDLLRTVGPHLFDIGPPAGSALSTNFLLSAGHPSVQGGQLSFGRGRYRAQESRPFKKGASAGVQELAFKVGNGILLRGASNCFVIRLLLQQLLIREDQASSAKSRELKCMFSRSTPKIPQLLILRSQGGTPASEMLSPSSSISLCNYGRISSFSHFIALLAPVTLGHKCKIKLQTDRYMIRFLLSRLLDATRWHEHFAAKHPVEVLFSCGRSVGYLTERSVNLTSMH